MFIVASPLAAADKPNYRTIGNDRYQIVDRNTVYIYTLDVHVRKGALEKNYFFSVGPGGDVQPLTILNLKKAFPNNHTFHDYLDMSFKHDSHFARPNSLCVVARDTQAWHLPYPGRL